MENKELKRYLKWSIEDFISDFTGIIKSIKTTTGSKYIEIEVTKSEVQLFAVEDDGERSGFSLHLIQSGDSVAVFATTWNGKVPVKTTKLEDVFWNEFTEKYLATLLRLNEEIHNY